MGYGNLLQQAKKSQERQEEMEKWDASRLPIIYPMKGHSMQLKIVYDRKTDLLLREIYRHDGVNGSKKTPCLEMMYGVECPVCKACENIKAAKGEYPKQARKARAIAFAQIVSSTYPYTKRVGGNDVPLAPGDFVVFMMPMTIYHQINNLVIQGSENLETLIDGNVTKVMNVTVSDDFNYNIQPDPYATYTSFESSETYDEFVLTQLPALDTQSIPSALTDELKAHSYHEATALTNKELGNQLAGSGFTQGGTNGVGLSGPGGSTGLNTGIGTGIGTGVGSVGNTQFNQHATGGPGFDPTNTSTGIGQGTTNITEGLGSTSTFEGSKVDATDLVGDPNPFETAGSTEDFTDTGEDSNPFETAGLDAQTNALANELTKGL